MPYLLLLLLLLLLLPSFVPWIRAAHSAVACLLLTCMSFLVLGVKPRAHGLLDPPDGGAGKDESEGSREIAQTTNNIHHSSLTLCCRSVLSSPLLGVAALGVFSSFARASSRSGESGTSRSDASRARRERTGRRPKPRTQRTQLPPTAHRRDGRTPCPGPVDSRACRRKIGREASRFSMPLDGT